MVVRRSQRCKIPCYCQAVQIPVSYLKQKKNDHSFLNIRVAVQIKETHYCNSFSFFFLLFSPFNNLLDVILLTIILLPVSHNANFFGLISKIMIIISNEIITIIIIIFICYTIAS